MKNSPLVSVIMIAYKHEPFIGDAINGVLMQEVNFPVELIIADDCSPDKTEGIVNSFRTHKNHEWIKYTKHSANKGMMSNFIWALQQAKGKYIALCEGDDYWTDPLKLQKQVDFLEKNHDIVIVSHNAAIQIDNTHLPGSGISFDCKVNLNNVISYNMMNTLAVVFKNRLLQKDFEALKDYPIGDWPLFCFLLKYGDGYLMKDNMATYRIHDTGCWSNLEKSQIVELNLKVLTLFLRDFPGYERKIKRVMKLLKTDFDSYNNLYLHLDFYKKNRLLNMLFNHMFVK